MPAASILPLALVVDDEAINRTFARGVLQAAGWRVREAADGQRAIAAAARETPDLILMDLHMAGLDGPDTTAALRALGGALLRVPIIAFTTTRLTGPGLLVEKGFDGHLAKPCTPVELTAVAARWQPTGILAGATRLEAVFGAGDIARLVVSLRDELARAVSSLDEVEWDKGEAAAGVGAEARVLAHRIAGIAGTLGFASVSESWRAVSEGDHAAIGAARRNALRAIDAIDRAH